MAKGRSVSGGKRRGCRRIGCGGCLVLLGLAFLAAVVLGWGAFSSGGALPAEPKLERLEVPLGSNLEPTDSEPPLGDMGGVNVLRIDLSYGQFEVVSGLPGEPLRIEADYDEANYKLTQTVESDGLSWTGEIRFGRRRGWWSSITDARNRVKITLPTDVPFELDARIRMGESELDLGGLPLNGGTFDFGMGDHEIYFSEPLPQPIGELTVKASMGAVRLLQIGHASPESFRAEHSMGDLEIDLRGDWQNSCDVRADQTMGALSLRAASNVGIDLDSTNVFMGGKDVRLGEGFQAGAKHTLKLDLAVTMGELRVRP